MTRVLLSAALAWPLAGDPGTCGATGDQVMMSQHSVHSPETGEADMTGPESVKENLSDVTVWGGGRPG